MEITEMKLIPSELGLSKSEIQKSASNAVDIILETGTIIEAAEMLSATENFIKEVRSHNKFIPYLREEIAKNGKAIIRSSGSKIELAEVGTKYDYSQCNDFMLPVLQKEIDILTLKIKDRESFLKNLPLSGTGILNEDTGELVTVYPPSKTSTSSYKVTLAK